jgi:hypothetical protein
MPRKVTITSIVVSIVFVVTLLVTYAQPFRSSQVELPASAVNSTAIASPIIKATREKDRRLALQPEALKVARRTGGERFKSRADSTLVVQGVVRIDGDTQHVSITRRQVEDGERVEVALGGGRNSFVWAGDSGPQNANGGTLSQAERALLERLTYDSADQFVLAQLRGASYSVVIRNLRPDDAGEDYAGPLWDVVRVDDPETDEQKRPLSTWRLYYINCTTGLIDKIVSEALGERTEAQLSEWTERNGEKFPASITWSRSGQTLMTFNLVNVSVVSH